MAPTIAILGATGQTGRSIVDGLLSKETPPSIPPTNIISLTRLQSLSNASNTALASLGLTIRAFTLTSPHETLVSALKGVDILISCMSGAEEQLQQIPLADAAKEAGVSRFIPSAWLPVIPPGGVHIFRDLKEQVYAHVKAIGLPFTIVDVGWWYQIAFPKLPSGKIDYAMSLPVEEVYGDGQQESALTDLRDVGRYVARVVQDERTVDKYVFCYNELHSQLDTIAILEKLSGESIPRKYVSLEEIDVDIAEALPVLQTSGMDLRSGEGAIIAFKAVARQYVRSWGIRGDNTPERAKELGYVTSKELWPEMEFVKYEDFLGDVVAGKAKPVYEDKREGYLQAWEILKEQKRQKQQQSK